MQARAHLRLESSSPAQGDTIRQPLSQILLTFSQAVEQRYTVITLLDAGGRELTMGRLHVVGSAPGKQYMLKLERPLMAGAFTVKWKTAAADGHAVSGMFDFVVDAAESTPPPGVTAPAASADPAADHHTAVEIEPLYVPESSLAWIFARWLNFFALLLIVGAVAFRFGVLERARTRVSRALMYDLDGAVRKLAVLAALTILVSNALRLWLQSGSLHGSARMWEQELLSAMVFQTGWGKAWLAQTVAAIGILVASLIKTEDRLESWFSAAAFAVIAGATPAFSGHAAAVQQMAIVPVLDDAVHVIAAAAWLGTLAVMLLAAVPVALRSADGVRACAALVNAFSPFALTMAGLAVFTGGLNAFMHISAIPEFWTTPYGRVLSLKIGVVILAITMGAYNWRVVKPRLGSDAATSHLRKSATSEILMGAVIVLITAVLVATPTP
jgi:putative copper export protein/methionine-rich copper-binding protein CopC